MVELECDSCGTVKEFPDTLTVVDEPIDGWELEFEEEDYGLRVTAAYCQECHSDE